MSAFASMVFAASSNPQIQPRIEETNVALNSMRFDAPTDGANALTPSETIEYDRKNSQKSGSGNCIYDPLAYVESGNQNAKVELNPNGTNYLFHQPESPNEFTTSYMATVRQNRNMSETDYMGCGRIGLFTIFDYLANYGNYNNFYDDYHNIEQSRVNLMTYILNHTDSINWFGQGTFSGPSAINYSMGSYLALKGYGGAMHAEGGISGDKDWKISFIKENIDENIPLLVFTPHHFGYYRDHYMTITGYCVYTITESGKDVKTKTMLRIDLNWGSSYAPCWFDTDWFDGEINCSIIAPKMDSERVDIDTSDFNFGTAYPDATVVSSLSKGNHVYSISRKRCHNYNNECIVLSAQKKNCGVSWLEFDSDKDFKCLQIHVSFWRENDFLLLSSSVIQIQYAINNSPDWQCGYDIKENEAGISKDRTLMNSISITFPNGAKHIRLYNETLATGDRNKGRVAFDDLSFFQAI